MPDWMQIIARADPLSHFLVIVQGVFLKGMGAADVGRKVLPMLAIAAVTLSAADCDLSPQGELTRVSHPLSAAA